MKNINKYLFTGWHQIQEGVYIVDRDYFWTYLSAGDIIETGICDWWYDVAAIYPEDTILFQPVDTTKDMMDIDKDTIYRGVHNLDDDPEQLCYYAVLDTRRLPV